MIVIDAPVVVHALTDQGPLGERARQRVEAGQNLHAPHVIDIEVLGVLRAYERSAKLSPEELVTAFAEFSGISIVRHPHDAFSRRVWELRHTVTVKDASYVALAEALNVPLVTLDIRLTRAPGPKCQMETL